MALGGRMENGWPECDLSDCDYATVPGTPLRLPFRKGHPFIILQAFLRDLNEFIEPLMNARGATDEGSWTDNNSVYTSNHKGATAFDYNWSDHPMGNANAGWNGSVLIAGDQVPAVRELLRFYTYRGIQLVWWGNDWNSPKDSMHFQMGYNTVNNPQIVQEFIDKFIRPDGFSTFRRGGAAPSAPVVDAATILARATGIAYAKAQEILPTLRDGLILADCKSVPRIAMFVAQTCWESDHYNATEEYANGPLNEERWIYKGRTWIQLTWKSAYAGFGQWCFERGLVNDPNIFVNHPRMLAETRWAGLGAAYYWLTTRRPTRKYPTLNQASDARDVLVATQIINGGTTHLAERQALYNRAIALGDDLLLILGGDEDEMAGWDQTKVDRAMVLLENIAGVRRKSRSPLRWPYEKEIDTAIGFAWTADANVHVQLVEKLAVIYGDPTSIALLTAVANTDEPGREGDRELARRILARCSEDAVQEAHKRINEWLEAEKAHKVGV
ncbi:endolysin [Mycobacterium phage Severus]|uniref:endolysin n=1 Tax=Mycobacterium phage Severus TaxID=1327776 RepID=UPI00032B2B03|nr:endolysin [Mycobacterium phage Severus]AGK87940.1 lysin A [Mycobacterium phage Severus]QWS69292.1 lysin A [Mycobacterium Phage PeaceMeal1]USL89142.1 lysin A [Mycobacterium phage Poompha]